MTNKKIYQRWSEQEEEILERLYPRPDISIKDIQKVLIDRTYEAIKYKAKVLGLLKNNNVINIDYDVLKEIEI